MKLLILTSFLLCVAGCSNHREDPYFDIKAVASQHSTDPKKGILIKIYPMELGNEKEDK